MTNSSMERINRFLSNGELDLVPLIIISMQEEDNVSNIIRGKNRFNILRNYCAHEPDTVITSLKNSVGTGYFTLYMKSADGVNDLSIDLATLTVWFIDVYIQTGNHIYLLFIRHLVTILNNMKPVLVGYIAPPRIAKASLLEQYVTIQHWWYTSFGKIKTLSTDDKYLMNILQTNPKVFWKIVIPNFTEFVFSIFDVMDSMDNSGFEFILNIAAARNEILTL